MKMEQWLKTRPQAVQNLAKEFPPGSKVKMLGKDYYLVGYTEDDCLLISEINPATDYDEAVETRLQVCAKHFRTEDEGCEGAPTKH